MANKRIFVSCGQEADGEISLGQEILKHIQQHGNKGFFAQEVHSVSDLNAEVFRAIQSCDGFFAVMHKRGEVKYREFPLTHRSSVWIQQEIAVLSFRNFLQQRHVPIRVYMEKEILLEGLMRTTIVNPYYFEKKEEVLEGLSRWLTGAEFEEHPRFARRESVFRRRIQGFQDDDWLILELISAHSVAPGDMADYHEILSDFCAILREKGLNDQQTGHSYSEARRRLMDNGLVREIKDPRAGTTHIGIAKQWWDLVLEELRTVGRMV